MKQEQPITRLRKTLGLNQVEFAALLGLRSKGQVSEIENTNRCSVRVALKIEELSQGSIDAAIMSDEVAMARGLKAAS